MTERGVDEKRVMLMTWWHDEIFYVLAYAVEFRKNKKIKIKIKNKNKK